MKRTQLKITILCSNIFTSHLSGRGNKIGPMFPCFRLSVSAHGVIALHNGMSPKDVSRGVRVVRVVRQRWGVFMLHAKTNGEGQMGQS